MNVRSLRSISAAVLILTAVVSSGTALAQESSTPQSPSGSGSSGSPASSGSSSSSAFASTSARLIQPLSITNLNSLDFGTLIKGAMSGPVTITVDPRVGNLPSITSSQPAAVAPLRGHTDATFHVTGEAGELVLISYPASITLQKNAGGTPATEMTVSNFNLDVWQSSDPNTDLNSNNSFTMPGGGVAYLEAGGTLTVEADDELGQYTGSFPVTVSYL